MGHVHFIIKSEELTEKILKHNCKVYHVVTDKIFSRDFDCEKHEGIPFTACENQEVGTWIEDDQLIYLN